MPDLRQDSSPARVRVALYGAVQGVGFRPFVHRLASELALSGWVSNSGQGVLLEAEGQSLVLATFLRRLQSENPSPSFIQSQETTWLDPVGYPTFEIRASQLEGRKRALLLPDIATCPECLREIRDPKNRRYRYPFTNCTHCGPRFSIIEALPYDRANTSMRRFGMCPECQAEYADPRDRRFHAQPNACPVCGPRLELWREAGAISEPVTRDATELPRASSPGLRPPSPRSALEERDGERRHTGSPEAEIATPSRPSRLRHEVLSIGDAALLYAAKAIRDGQIVAVKGLGGFHLLVDARNELAVQRLRDRKHREEKPFALLFPSLDAALTVCAIEPLAAALLQSAAAPIVLLAKRGENTTRLASSVAPGNPNLGVMLPSNPLQHLLLAELGFPVVATSGNLSDEPLCTDEYEALERLHGLADLFLVHNRPIVRHLDDSIVRLVMGREMVLRRARGYAPLPVTIPAPPRGAPPCPAILAVGAHLKNSVALAVEDNVFLSQHIGDLETPQADQAFRRVIADFQALYEIKPDLVAADLHPDYLSTQFAMQSHPERVVQVQHHVAHVLACLAENATPLPALGVAWDGTGYGLDGTIWGGEFFVATPDAVERVASLRPFRLPGGDTAAREPRRAAVGMLFAMQGAAGLQRRELPPVAAFAPAELALLQAMLERGLQSPLCSSMGRWFDAVAAWLGLRQRSRFEGQAAMDLEFALAGVVTEEYYELPLVTRADLCLLDWAPVFLAMEQDRRQGRPAGEIAAKFHNTLAESVVAVARRFEMARVALSGGCFQNRYLLERTVTRLRAAGLQPYWHQRVPPNDGGIALGQVLAARRAQSPARPEVPAEARTS